MVWLPVEELQSLDWDEADCRLLKSTRSSLIVLTPELGPYNQEERVNREKEGVKGV